MILHHAVIVHGFVDAKTALAPGLPATLLSGPGAAVFAGAGWWLEVMAAARSAFPATPMTHLLDCGDAPGRAFEALRLGLPGLVLDALCPAFPEVARAASACGALLLDRPPPALDLATPGAIRRLAAWLGRPQ